MKLVKTSTALAAKRERINGFAAGVALLELYQDWRSDDSRANFDAIPIQEFAEKLTEVDKRAVPGFWLVLHEYLNLLATGNVPDVPEYFTRYLNLADEDLRKVRVQLGYESEASHGS